MVIENGGYVVQLLEAAIIDTSRGVCGTRVCYDYRTMVNRFYWYYVPSASLARMGLKKAPQICLCAEKNSIRVYFSEDDNSKSAKKPWPPKK